MEPATVAGLVAAEQVVSTTVEGAYGLAQPTQPLSATLTRVSSPAFLPRYNHSLTVIGGRAYVFGGETEDGKLAGGEVHIVTLPLGRKREKDGEVDYKCVPSLGEGEDGSIPEPRSGHTACAIGERMYVYGGKSSEGNPIEEAGRVWVFDTNTLGWDHIDPSDTDLIPAARYLHSSTVSSRPLPQQNASAAASYSSQFQSTIGKLPSLIGKGSSPQEPHGTLIIHGGITSNTIDKQATDTYAFNIITHTWAPLPPSPSASTSPSTPTTMTLANETLYTVTTSNTSSELASELHTLHLDIQTFTDSRGSSDLTLTASKESWSITPFPTNPLTPGPRSRKGAGLVPVTTGNGRVYLLLFMGERVASSSSSSTGTEKVHDGENAGEEAEKEKEKTAEYWSDIYSYQLPSARSTPAGIKDATRSALGFSSGEGTWAEVKVDAGEEVTAEAGDGQGTSGGKAHPGPRGWFACSAVEGARAVLWGGRNGKGEVEGDGWLLGVKIVG